jgi:competence protein ComEC
MVAVPLSAVLVMPAALIGVLLMPVGGEALGLVPMGWGIALINWLAVETGGWPGAVVKVAAFPVEALAAIALGGLWICLWRGRWRWGGLAVVAAGCLAAMLARPPDLLVSPDGKLVAVATGRTSSGSGPVRLAGAKGQRFTAESWLARYAEDQPQELGADPSDESARCDALGCIYKTGRHTVALVRDPRALAEDCRIATIVISSVPVRYRCASAELVIDRIDLWRAGAHALWLDDDRVVVESVRDRRGVRPWARAPEQRRRD